MPITYEETVQTVLNLIQRVTTAEQLVESLRKENNELKRKLKSTSKPE